MTNEIQVFSNEKFGQVRTVMQDGEPWFVAADVCKAFGVDNSRNIVARLDDDEKGVHNVDTLGGKQTVTIINEAGLYHALFTMEPKRATARGARLLIASKPSEPLSVGSPTKSFPPSARRAATSTTARFSSRTTFPSRTIPPSSFSG